MRTGILYLNNSGSRWIVLDSEGKKEKITLLTKSGKEVTRTVMQYQSFGNFTIAKINYKGKTLGVFTDTILED